MKIGEIKSRLSLQTVLDHYGLKPDRNHRLLCPWHDDKTPSLQIYPKTNTWTCFSSKCDAGSGDQIEMIRRMENCSKHEAILKAKSLIDPNYGVRQIKPQQMSKANETPGAVSRKPLAEISRIAVLSKYYQSTLSAMAKSKRAMQYAEARCLEYSRLGIGYSGADIGKTWNKNLQESGEQTGILTRNKSGKYQPAIRYCLLFAMKNREGKIVDVYGRSIFDKQGARHFYLSGTQRGLYPGYPKPSSSRLILTESHIDAASLLQQSEITNEFSILALYGTNGFTEEHSRAIGSLELLEEVILFFDGDEAGEKAIKKWTQEIMKLNKALKVSYVATPTDEDVNSLLQNQGSASLVHFIDKRKPFYFSTEIDSIDEQVNSEGADVRGTSDGVNREAGGQDEKIKSSGNLTKLHTENLEWLVYEAAPMRIEILGGIRITGLDKLRVTLKIGRSKSEKGLPIRQSLDLYHGRQVDLLSEKIAEQMELGVTAARKILSDLTGALEGHRQQRLELTRAKQPHSYRMSHKEQDLALNYLSSSGLMERTLEDIKASGIVGEEHNALIGYLAYTGRKRPKPLHVMYLGSSGMGKTYLQEKLSELIPEEDKKTVTALSDQSLYYQGKQLKHKVLFLEDLDGAENVLYMIRELQSKGRISKTVVWKDAKGQMQPMDVVAEGPLCVSSCTTREKVYEDNANRCILLYIDEGQTQDKRVMAYQKMKSAGKVKSAEEELIKAKHRNVQRLLQPVKVINPFAEVIDLPAKVFKPRRSLQILLSFIETISFYHQYQRKVHVDPHTGQKYIRTTVEDIRWAFRLMKEVLFTKSDELHHATRAFLECLKKQLGEEQVFYTQAVRKAMRISPSAIHRYVSELRSKGYIRYKGGNRYRGYEYQIEDRREYSQLTGAIENHLAEILNEIKNKYPGVPPVSHPDNGIMEALKTNALA